MPLLLSVLPEIREDGLYLHIFTDQASCEVGPIIAGTMTRVELMELPPEKPIYAVTPRARKIADAEELLVATSVGGRKQPGSGSKAHAKGDVRKRGELRYEAKTTSTGAFRVTPELLQKIRSECGPGEKPAFGISFKDKNGQTIDRWVCITFEDWNERYQDR